MAHDVPQRYFDRGLAVAIGSHEIRVTYQLSLSHLTMADELLSLVGAGGMSGTGATDRLNLYADKMGPLLARGLVVTVDGIAVELSYRSATHMLEDHPRFHFELAGPLELPDRDEHTLQLEDTSFFLEKGLVRIAIRAETPCELKWSDVPSSLEAVLPKSGWEMTPEQQDAARRAQARWVVGADIPNVATADAAAAPGQSNIPSDSASETHRIHDLTGLLDRWSEEFYVVLLGLAFFFGAAHAMTPGHGKTMVAAYLVGERGTMWHAVGLGLTTSITHTSSVLLVALLLRLAGHELQNKLSAGFALLSGLLVAGLGAALLVARLRRSGTGCRHAADGGGAACEHATGTRAASSSGPGWSGLITLGVSGGIVPCPDAIVLLLIATAQGQIEQAVVLLLCFSAGLASALVLVGILAVRFRGFLASRLGSGRIVQSLPVMSAAAILMVGLYLCFSTLRQPMGMDAQVATSVSRTAAP
jgi:nickel/cobalt exporter